MITSEQLDSLRGAQVLDVDGQTLGRVAGFFLDNSTGLPSWASVQTNSANTDGALVPLAFADLRDGSVRVPYGAGLLQFVPVRATGQPLTPEQERQLYDFYGIDVAPSAAAPADPEHATLGSEYLVRSEERLRVDTERVAVGRAHLRKFVVTEMRTITVPVKRDVVRVVYEPLAKEGEAPWSPDDGGEDVGVDTILTEERINVSTEVIAVERVRLSTVEVAGEQPVVAPVRSEQIDVVIQRSAQDAQSARSGQAAQ